MSSTSRKTSFSSSLIVERWRAKHQLQFLMSTCMDGSYRCTQVPWRVRQILQMRGGRKTVTKANNRKHKTRTGKTLGVEPFSVGKTKPKRRYRLPPTTAVRVTVQATLQCCKSVLSPTLLIESIRKKKEKSCSNSFSGLIFQVLRTQRSSVSITLSVFKQKKQK